LKLISSHFVI